MDRQALLDTDSRPAPTNFGGTSIVCLFVSHFPLPIPATTHVERKGALVLGKKVLWDVAAAAAVDIGVYRHV